MSGQEDEALNILLYDVPKLPAAPWSSEKSLISSLTMLAASLLFIREAEPFTADVITASGSSCAGTNKHRLRGAGGGPLGPQTRALEATMGPKAEVSSAKLVGREREFRKQSAWQFCLYQLLYSTFLLGSKTSRVSLKTNYFQHPWGLV